jgi:hypothetical protein
MIDDPLEQLSRAATPPLDDADFTRAALRRAGVRPRRMPRRVVHAAAALAAALVAFALTIVAGPIGPALAALAAITWATGRVGDR